MLSVGFVYGSPVTLSKTKNMRNLKFKEFREQLKSSSRFFLGSNKVMKIALGRSAADEIRPGIRKVSKLLHGNTGLFQ
ncbi:hypothetical protein MLD38_032186 [Melastoma candidum]|uniref:Uncharacterized protein n=1 Tax=Melastoma candidum TaxID=119954 RepID=A0ACB9M3B5_9MYRT|nr:hypothetical protein MLD38_032186 [Melastoma candidum]